MPRYTYKGRDKGRDCQFCGTWVCKECGWSRANASLKRVDQQFCVKCGCKEAKSFRPTRHKNYRTHLTEEAYRGSLTSEVKGQ